MPFAHWITKATNTHPEYVIPLSHGNNGYVDVPHAYVYTGCPRRNVPDFGRVFFMLKYTDITQNTYNQS